MGKKHPSILSRSSEVPLRVGGMYSFPGPDGFTVAKILAVDEIGVHVRLYKNRFRDAPTAADCSRLTVGSMDDADGFGIGHFPVSRQSFFDWQPTFFLQSDICEEELEGYKIWLDSKGGYF